VCLQIESPEDDQGNSAVWAGTIAAMEMGDPAIEFQKTPDMQTVQSGSAVIFTIRVENAGNMDLTDVAVSDSLAPACGASLALLEV